MPPARPSGIDNQPAWLHTAEACALLGVKRETLYSYASRGFVRRLVGSSGSQYAHDDLLRLKARSAARAGDGPVAVGAMRFGEPVLETAISLITPQGPAYRGVPFSTWLLPPTSFEAVAEFLWNSAPREWPVLSEHAQSVIASLPPGTPCLHAMLATAAWPQVVDSSAQALIRTLAASIGVAYGVHLKSREESIAATFLRATRTAVTEQTIQAINRVLVIVADHELNPSTFAARIAASVGASLPACVAAALATMTGPSHGGESDRLELLLDRLEQDPTLLATVCVPGAPRIPGFGHTLYPTGDPRATALMQDVPTTGAHTSEPLAMLNALIRVAPEYPNLDAGLVAFRRVWGLPRGAGSALFALGRTAGWIAHAEEQRATGVVLRPRARYVGR